MPGRMLRCALIAASAFLIGAAYGDDVPRGQIIDSLKCLADASQSYALYLPSNYSPDRKWNVILAFDPGGRGRRPVERYQAAAEKYGYILAGSNNSRNGPWDVSLSASQAMWADVAKRFSINPQRVYTAGHSGGSRVAMRIALDNPRKIAGVFAHSAAFPDEPQTSLGFPVFGTAGTEDFNYLEMREFDNYVTSAHRVVIFEGGHSWPPGDLAVAAVEWMEVQAMKSGKRPQDKQLMARVAQAEPAKWNDAANLKREQETTAQLYKLESELGANDDEQRSSLLNELRGRLTDLSNQARAAADSPERRMARRILSGLIAGSRGIDNPEYLELLKTVRPPQAPNADLR